MYFFTYMYLSILIIGGYRLNGVSKSFVFCTINEPSDLGDENIDETVSANTLNDSLTIEKEINNEETPSQMNNDRLN
jgi:hypothetical protein